MKRPASSVLRASRPPMLRITSPLRRPASAAGEFAPTAEITARPTDTSCGTVNANANSTIGSTRLMTDPDASTINRCHAGRLASERGCVGSSSPSRRTKPPSGIQFSEYSVSPKRFAKMRGGKPTPNSSTCTPNSFAVKKCASSCATTRLTRMTMKISADCTALRANIAATAIATTTSAAVISPRASEICGGCSGLGSCWGWSAYWFIVLPWRRSRRRTGVPMPPRPGGHRDSGRASGGARRAHAPAAARYR